MSTPFDEWLLEDARVAVQLTTERAAQLDNYRKYLDGNMFNAWEGWVGPTPDATDQDSANVRAEIERGFVSRGVISEVTGRHVSGVLGRDIKFSLVTRRKLAKDAQPTTDEQARIDEATDLLTTWVDDRKLNQEYDKLGENLLVAGVAYQRPFVAPGEVDSAGIVPEADLATSLGRVYFNFPLPGEAVVYTDPRTQAKCSIYLYREVVSSRPSEVAGKQGDERAELTYLDGDQTIIRIVGTDGTIIPENQVDFSLPLGKRILMSDMHRRPLLNPQVVSQQKLLNLALTMKQRNVIMGGFLERVAINAQMNGQFEDLPDGKRRFVPDSMPVGAGAMTTLTGYETEDALGNKTLATPNMLWREPVNVKTFLDTEASAYEAILAECNQAHYAAAGSTGISAEARLVSMAAYLIDLLQTAQQVNAGWSWLLETALALAAILSGQAGRFDDLRVSAECSVDPGPISPDTMKTVQALAGNVPLLSVKTAQARIGVEDVSGEQANMEEESANAQEAAQAGTQQTAAMIQSALAQLDQAQPA